MAHPPSPLLGQPNAHDDPDFEYAYYFPEGSGYLFVQRLGSGQYGLADIVWSCAEAARANATLQNQPISNNGNDSHGQGPDQALGKYMVRKKTRLPSPPHDNLNNQVYPLQNPEISNYRDHHLIPRLIDWTEYRPLPRDHQHHLRMVSNAMIFQFCNGGTLSALWRDFEHLHALQATVYIPEAFIWTAFGQLLEVINWLHHLRPGIYHADLHSGNIFLHFSKPDQIIPDCFLGDFGVSQTMPSDSWDTNGRPVVRNAEPKMEDYKSFLLMMKEMITLQDSYVVGSDSVERRYNAMAVNHSHYSALLYAVLQRFENSVHDCVEDRSLGDFADLAQRMIAHGKSINGLQQINLRNTVRYYPSGPKSFRSANELLFQPEDERPNGPWKVAKIRSDTKAIVALSREVYRTYEPLPVAHDADWAHYAPFFRPEDVHSIHRSNTDMSVTGM